MTGADAEADSVSTFHVNYRLPRLEISTEGSTEHTSYKVLYMGL